MNHSTRRAVATAAALVAAASVVPLSTAEAAGSTPSKITVRSSDHEVKPGEQFILRGRMSSAGKPVEDATVRVHAFRDGGWQRLPGAVVTTGEEGRYRVRVILSSGGDRDLRVVGDPRGDRIRIARAHTTVRVLG